MGIIEIFIGLAIILLVFCSSLCLSRWLREPYAYRDINDLMRRNRISVIVGNVIAYISLLVGAMMYVTGLFEDKDWRGIGVIFASAIVLSISVVVGVSSFSGLDRVREGMVALAYSNKLSPFLFYSVSAIALCLGIFSVFSLLTE